MVVLCLVAASRVAPTVTGIATAHGLGLFRARGPCGRSHTATPVLFPILTGTHTGTEEDGAPPASSDPPTLPLFDPGSTTVNGLRILADVAAAAKGRNILPQALLPLLTQPGPFNPATALSAKIAKKILDLEFVEMSEVTVDNVLPAVPGHPPPPARLPISDISQWVERYSLMAAVLCSKYPDKAGELFAYQASIIHTERNYEGKRRVAYDRQYRRQALARQDLNWSVTDPHLYNKAFTGRARSIARCSFCLQDDHAAGQCPRNPHRPIFGWFPDQSTWTTNQSAFGPPSSSQRNRPVASGEICRRFNEGRCRFARCHYRQCVL